MVIKELSKGVIAGVLFMYLFVGATYADAPRKHITIAVFPCTDVVMSFKKFHPLITYLKEETGLDIRLGVPKDSAEFERAMKIGDIDFAFQDPHMYVRLAHLYDRGSLIRALTREGKTSQSGVVIVRKGSGISKLEDLKGKTVMFGPKLSAAKWVAARELFEESNIDIDKDLRAYSHGGCCEDIAFSVFLKAVDAGVVCDHFLDEHIRKQQELGVDVEQIVIVCRTKSIPKRVFAASKEISNDIVAEVNQALLKLDKKEPAHAKILYRAELGGFQKLKDEDYDGKRMLKNVKTAE